MKTAKLVSINLVTRVIVDDNASENEILRLASEKFIEKISNEIDELKHNLEFIVDDEECPFDSNYDE